MDADTRTRLVAGLSPTKQAILDVLRRGKMTVTEMRPHIGRADGMSQELEHLRKLGLIRHVGTAPRTKGRGMRPWLYELVPDAEIEQVAAEFKPRRSRRRKMSTGSALGELRRMEPGTFSRWHSVRKRVLDLTQMLVAIEPMGFWHAAPPQEIDVMLMELLDLQEWTDKVMDAFAMRLDDNELRRKIEMLRRVEGREPAEAESFLRAADRLEARLKSAA
jgi:hypothetical protein